MEQYTDSQYDDDLTIGTDEYDDSFETADIDLFEFGGDDDSPISRLKTLVLSIDWEITDEVLLQFHDEVLDLKDIWASDKINMVYLQALEKIGLYIYKEKADSHPNSIKLLLSMYYNLERIVLSDELSGAEKKQILMEDVRRFEKLKKLIGKSAQPQAPAVDTIEPAPVEEPEALDTGSVADELMDLKAIVLGIDWEITDKDLLELREEVKRLESVYAGSKPKLVFLQGIGTLGAYIRKKKSNSHADAFKLLHSFYAGLEKIVNTPDISLAEEKKVLFPEVEKFNLFKQNIAQTLTEEDEGTASNDVAEAETTSGSSVIAPAFADMDEESTHGFQEEEEAASLSGEGVDGVDERLDRFFGEEEPAQEGEAEQQPAAGIDDAQKEADAFSEAFFGTAEESEPPSVDKNVALQGVDVETEADDDSDEEQLPVLGEGEIAPALADSSDISAFSEQSVEETTDKEELSDELSGRLDSFFGGEAESDEVVEEQPETEVPADVALQGVDVEIDDEDEDEQQPAAGTMEFGEIAPAFADIEDELDDDLVVPEDVLSDSELPMEPTEFGKPAPDTEDDAVDAELQAELAELESEVEPEVEPEPEAVVADDEELAALVPENLEDDLAALDEPVDEEPPVEDEPAAEAESEVAEGVDQFFALDEEEPEPSTEETLGVHSLDDEQEVAPALAEFEGEEPAEETIAPALAEADDVEVAEGVDQFFELDEEEAESPVAEELTASSLEDEQEVAPALTELSDEQPVDDTLASALADAEAEDVTTDEGEEIAPALADFDEETAKDAPEAEMAEDVSEPEQFATESDEEVATQTLADDGTFDEAAFAEPADELTDEVAEDFADSSEEALAFAGDDELSEPVEEQEDVVFELAEDDEPQEMADETAVADAPEEDTEAQRDLQRAAIAGAAAAAGAAFVATLSDSDEKDEEAQEAAEEPVAVAEVTEDDGQQPPLSLQEVLDDDSPFEEDAFSGLRGAVQSLTIDMDEQIIQGLYSEINSLRQRFVNSPFEKTYLQLMSTVVQHIDQFRFNADDTANELMLSIIDDLARSESGEAGAPQENLLSTITRVLQWQQNLITNVAGKDEDGFLTLQPVGAEEPQDLEPSPAADQEVEPAEVLGTAVNQLDESEPRPEPTADDRQFSEVIRNEISALRDTLKREIEELKNSLKK